MLMAGDSTCLVRSGVTGSYISFPNDIGDDEEEEKSMNMSSKVLEKAIKPILDAKIECEKEKIMHTKKKDK